ncbi:MAG: 23S rRNA (pseudouridine(1915)-N(3))-methyltransferase RlmH [Firmicutes bacterium]|nr:23S rRNA (pseudouridine(1915)-N(3))-methyltransferase RlmH [Bacillota bacterium]MBR0440816.1 23S rRNA (pseudouridine(1915)-N(3))-methyltransferase RlmH [Bacillota bacterium]
MNIEIICTGKLKERYWQDAAAEYSKRLSRFCKLTITELPESRLPDKAGPAEEQQVIESESRAVLKKLESMPQSFVIALAVNGKSLSSEQLAEKIGELGLSGRSRVVFVIGGSLGLSEELLRACDMRLSFSAMTFPHQMMRVILLEQIYRAFKINAGENYHK